MCRDEIFSEDRVMMLTDALVLVSGGLPDIICITQITFKEPNNALYVDNRRLDFFDT